MAKYISALFVVGLVLIARSTQAAPIVFDDFSVNEGHFNVAPNFSGTSTGEDSTSTADRVTTESVDPNGGAQQLVFKHDGSTATLRIRHLSSQGSPATTVTPPNVVFSTGPGTDGFIGFYLKVPAGQLNGTMQVQIALDGAGNVAAEMDGGINKPITADGEWHLYEWDLDNPADWTSVSGIGGTSPVTDGTHTIDSIMFHTGGTGTAGQVKLDGYLDFVAKTDTGSVAALIPEPASLGLLAVAIPAMLRRRR